MTEQQIRIFTTSDGQAQLEVALDRETVWLNQNQMATLFDTSTDNVGLHLKNIYREGELEEASTTEDFSVVRLEGKRQVQRRIKHYNLDAIISVGYRVSSKRATQFRQWATQTLKDHLVQGYTLNQRRLTERGIEFEQVVDLLSRTLSNQGLVSSEGEAITSVISDYARSWSLLQGYDEQALSEISARQPGMHAISLEDALSAIGELKRELIAKGEATELFGQLRGDGLASALATIEQGFGEELFYPNIASRAARSPRGEADQRQYPGGARAIGGGESAGSENPDDSVDRTLHFAEAGKPMIRVHSTKKLLAKLPVDEYGRIVQKRPGMDAANDDPETLLKAGATDSHTDLLSRGNQGQSRPLSRISAIIGSCISGKP